MLLNDGHVPKWYSEAGDDADFSVSEITGFALTGGF